MFDSIGSRMQKNYEGRTKVLLPRRGYTIIRIDGRAFHTYTKGLERPFDEQLIRDMNETAVFLCKNIEGCKLAFVQSDEISLVLTDFDKLDTQAWFDNELQKIVSVSASLATARFNELRMARDFVQILELSPEQIQERMTGGKRFGLATFDSRAFTIPSKSEVINYLIWRQKDATRNSIQAVAQYLYTPKELKGKKRDELLEMIRRTGNNWNNLALGLKQGRLIAKLDVSKPLTSMSVDLETIPGMIGVTSKTVMVQTKRWQIVEAPLFINEAGSEIDSLIPDNL